MNWISFTKKRFTSTRCLLYLNVFLGVVVIWLYVNGNKACLLYELEICVNDTLSFEHWFPAGINADNVSGFPMNIVPNIVHYVLLDINEIQFAHFISILSVLKHHKPDEIMIHCNFDEIIGKNWIRVLKEANDTNTKITLRKVSKLSQVFGVQLRKSWQNWHSSDILRIEILMQFGGIYLDNDVYVVKSLNKFRKYEMTISWDVDQSLGNQVILANSNARFLKLWLNTYRYYDSSQWYFNAGQLPTKSILQNYPHLVHRIVGQFGVSGSDVCYNLYRTYFSDWKKVYYTIHLYMRGDRVAHNWCIPIGLKSPTLIFDEQIVKTLKVTFGEMARKVLYNQTAIIYT